MGVGGLFSFLKYDIGWVNSFLNDIIKGEKFLEGWGEKNKHQNSWCATKHWSCSSI
jgi:hypothetical protein